MSNTHDLTALKLYLQGSQEALFQSLTSKSEFIKAKYNSSLTEALMKKLKHEEDHIEICLRFIEDVDKLMKGFEKELRCKEMVLDFFKTEAKEYMDKFYNSIDTNAEYKLLKELTKK